MRHDFEMGKISQIVKMAWQVAKSAEGQLGPKPVSRVMREHRQFFEALRSQGAGWSDIARLLRNAGLEGRNGEPVSADVLRSLWSRVAGREAQGGTLKRPAGQMAALPAERLGTRRKMTSTVGKLSDTGDRPSISEQIERAARIRGGISRSVDE